MLDSTNHPQYLTYAAKVLRAGAWPMYKMSKWHFKPGTTDYKDDYPATWPTRDEWHRASACLGPVRLWCWDSVPETFNAVAAIRAAYGEAL